MKKAQIDKILTNDEVSDHVGSFRLTETHISYVLIGKKHVYKIKKPIKYSFIDFSTLHKRKHFCEREIILNNRLTKGIYLSVVPVREKEKVPVIDGNDGKIIDYAVKMKKLQESKQMHLMLEENLVTKAHMLSLATLIRKFHAQCTIIYKKFDCQAFMDQFDDIASVSVFIKQEMGKDYFAILNKAIKISDHFLKSHQDFFSIRINEGFVKDGHGDLHSRNIFLYKRPIIFDCLEFNDAFRHIDILDEIAFFCMDLEAAGLNKLSKAFTDYYFSDNKKEFGKKEQQLFTYYKGYRANVRAKVNALRALQASGPDRQKNLDEVKRYLALMDGYMTELNMLQ